MIKWFKNLFSQKEKEGVLNNEDVCQTIVDELGRLNELLENDFDSIKSRCVQIKTYTSNLVEFQNMLVELTAVVHRGAYVPERYKGRYLEVRNLTLEMYISDQNELIHPMDWLNHYGHHIIRLVDSLMKMEESDREYYQRLINFIVLDSLELIRAVKKSTR